MDKDQFSECVFGRVNSDAVAYFVVRVECFKINLSR